jgi:streptogramin lyase
VSEGEEGRQEKGEKGQSQESQPRPEDKPMTVKKVFIAPLLVLIALSVTATPALAVTTGLGPLSTFEGGEAPSGIFVPRGVAVDQSSGDVWVVDTKHDVVDEFQPEAAGKKYKYLAQIADGFSGPTGLAVDAAGNVYVVDTGNNLVKEFDPATSLTSPVHEFGTGALNGPTGVAVDSSENVYVVDTGDNVVKEFEPSTPTPKLLATFGENVLSSPSGVAVDGGDVYVVDSTGEVHVFNGAGVAQASLSNPTGYRPNVVSASPTGTLYVAYHNGEIVQYDALGDLLGQYSADAIQPCDFFNCEGPTFEGGGPGVWGMATGPTGDVYVSNSWSLSDGERLEQVVVFQPAPLPEALTVAPAREVTPATATVPGEVNPEGTELTVCEFQFGLATSYGQSAPCIQELASLTGSAFKSVTASVTGLEPSATYHYRLVVRSDGLVGGGDQTLTTAGEAPKVDSESASPVKSTVASLEAQVNPNNQETHAYMQYSASAAVIAGGPEKGALQTPTKTATPPGTEIGANFEDHLVGPAAVTGLAADSTYYYQAVATNATGTTYGPVEHFTTVPVPFTDPVTVASITATTATFNGHLTLNPLNTTVTTQFSFDFNPSATECVNSSTIAAGEAGPGSGLVSEEKEVSELQPNATYSVCFVTSNPYGSEVDPKPSLVQFKTFAAPPKIDGESVSAVLPSGAILEAQVNPNNEKTHAYLQYSTSSAVEGDGALKTPTELIIVGPEIGEGYGQLPISQTLSTLAAGTTYYYQAVAKNATGTVYGTVQSFTTQGAPLVTTGEAQAITRTTATLSGTVNPTGVETSYYFAYISEAGYRAALANGAAGAGGDPYIEGETTAPLSSSSDETLVVAPTPAGEMLPGTTYHYALVAKNVLGLTIGPDRTLTTLPGTPPIVSTGGVSAVSQNSATLSGTVATNSLQTEYGFEIGTEPGNYGPATGLGSIGGAQTEAVALTLGELQPGTTYYYRVTASNADGSSYGESETFTTPGFPTLLTPQTSPPLIANPAIAFPSGSGANTGTTTKALTNAQKLKKALKACKKDKSKSKRVTCEKQAHKKYPAAKKKGKDKKK